MSNALYPPQANLYLVGFMGVGKSAVGRATARHLGYRFIDSDRAIEERLGQPIKDFFASSGEAAFRVLEREFMEGGHPPAGCVVACGGGLVTPPGMTELVRSKGVAICLFASVETILRRTMNNDRRPLLNVPDPAARVRELLAQREAVYRSVGPGICTENRTITDVVLHIVRLYRQAVRPHVVSDSPRHEV